MTIRSAAMSGIIVGMLILPVYAQPADQMKSPGEQGRLSFRDYHLNNLNLYVTQYGEQIRYGGNLTFNYQGSGSTAPIPFASLNIPIQNKTFDEVAAIVRDPNQEIRKLFREDDEFIKRFEDRR